MSEFDLSLLGFPELARRLTTLGPVGTVPTVLATPTASRLALHLDAAGCKASLDLLPPSWFRDLVERLDHRASGMGNLHACWPGGLKAGAPILAHAHNRDEVSTTPPLTRLLQAKQDNIQPARLRTLDWLLADRQDCAVVVVGSGQLALPLLSSGKKLLDRHRPVVIIDVADVAAGLFPDPPTEAAALARDIMRLLPRYVIVASVGEAATRRPEAPARFLVAAPVGHVLHETSAACEAKASANLVANGRIEAPTMECWSARNVFTTNIGAYDPRAERVRWQGPPFGLSLLIECEASFARAQIIAHARFPNGLRVSVDGVVVDISDPERRHAKQEQPARRQPVRYMLDVPLPPAGGGPRLRHILLTPIRMSTTEPPPPFEIASITVSCHS